MRIWKALLHRSVASWSFSILLIVCALLPPLAYCCGEVSGSPGAGYVCAGADESSLELCALLDEAGFDSYKDKESLTEAIVSGEADCGAVIPESFGERLETGSLDGAIEFITSAMSLTPELWRSHISAAVFSLRAPYITAGALDGTGIDRQEALDRYRELMDTGYLFSFDIEYAEDAEPPQNHRARSLAMLAGGMSVFCTLMLPGCRESCEDYRIMKRRIGKRQAFKSVLMPQSIIRSVLTWFFAFLGFLMCGIASMALPLGIFVVALTLGGTAVHLIFRSGNVVWAFVVLMCAAAPVLCPVFMDLTLTLPWLKILRGMNMIYWLWPMAAFVP